VPGFDSYQPTGYRTKDSTLLGVIDQAWILRAPKSQLAEAYRQIRTSILLSSIDNPPRVLLVTSALSGDGKTTTSYNLAAAFATQAANVLLIGADMRRPAIPNISGCTLGNGLSDVLSSRVTLNDALQEHPLLPSLKILQAGTIPPDPAELLGSKRFADLIQELRSRFEYIVIDSPPVIPVTDSVVACASVDAVITVVRAGRTRKPDLKEMWTSLDKPTIRILGFVVNDYHSRFRNYNYEDQPSDCRNSSRERN
jgi:capsular exopolysaccharide synthesis family protein